MPEPRCWPPVVLMSSVAVIESVFAPVLASVATPEKSVVREVSGVAVPAANVPAMALVVNPPVDCGSNMPSIGRAGVAGVFQNAERLIRADHIENRRDRTDEVGIESTERIVVVHKLAISSLVATGEARRTLTRRYSQTAVA